MSPPMPFTYSVNEFTTAPWTFEEDLRRYGELGVEAIELCEDKLDPQRLDRQLAELADSGLPVCSVQPRLRTLFPSRMMPQPEGLAERLARIRASIERLAPYAPGAVFVVNTGPAPGGDIAGALDHVHSGLRRLAETAADHGVRIALEPLNPILLNAETMIWTFAQAQQHVRAVGHDSVGICVDTWNLWQDPYLAAGLRADGDPVFLLQVSDWRTPRSHADRRSVGTGPIPTSQLLHAAFEGGYRGPCVLEIFSSDVPDSLYDGDLAALIRDNRVALQRAWNGHP
ncbi:sugar phosphate isomerase/epimerase family protein [Actinomadura fulvescens]|uniref:Sugar phosphate isomerase/epimerase n=1 Tax=Actinomadura fulvescens TaxID=46160 RepID=A0ABP6DAA4_9ACTN